MYAVKVYVGHGYYQYEVKSAEQAISHGEEIMKTQTYRRVNQDGDLELHHVIKVKVSGADLGSQYHDKFMRT